MARGVNKVILIGNLGADPETRYTASGNAVSNLRLATSRSWRDKQSNETKEETEWHRVVLFSRLAEIAGEYLRKGSRVYIEGRIQTRKWQDKQGQDRWTTEVVAEDLQMLDSRAGGTASYDGDDPARSAASRPAPAKDAAPPPSDDDFDDDIPF